MRLVTETERLKALHDLKILDTDRERHFDAVCETARDLFGVPVALVTLIDGERAWFKARCGLDVESTPRDVAFCSRTIESDAVLVSEDTRADPRFAANPLVTGAPQVRFYAGAPLLLGPGLRVGTLCLIGFAPRDFGAADQQRLRSLADIVVAHLRLHDATVRSEAELAARRTREALIEAQARDLRHGQALLAQTEALADLGTWEFDPDTEEVTWSCNLRRIYDLPAGAPVTLETAWAGFEGDDRARIRAAFTDLVGRQRPFEITLPFRSLTGAPRIVRMVGAAEVADGRARRAFGIVQDITDHVAAVSRAQEANRLLLLAEEVARVGHWHVRLPDQHLTWSNEVFNIFGLEPAEGPPARERLRSLFHPDDRALARKLLVGLRDAQRDFDFEARIVRPDDEVRTVLVRGRSEKDETGAVRAYFGVIADITEQKRAEANLRESTALLRVTLDNMDQGLLMVGADDRVQVVNRRALELLGLPEAFMARKPSQLEVREYQMAAGEFERGGATLRRWLDGARMQTDRPVYERERPNGTVLEIRTVPLPGGGAVRTYTDITARRRAEAALAESEARYRLLAEHASDLIVLGHADGRRSYISPAARSMLGYEPEEAMRIGMRDVIHPDDLARVFATTTGLSRAAPQGSVVFRMRRKDGRYLFAEAAFTRVEHAGEITIVTAIRDVSERERQAAELTRAKEAAEEAQARAELANEAKTDFLASMSHEIRTPLNGILGYADLLIASPGLDEVQRRSVERIQNAGEALLTVVDDVLDFSKIEAGQVALDPTPFSPKALAGDAVSIVSTVADRKGLPVRVELDPGLPAALLGDEARLRQILLNLLNNAVKFTREGSVTVRLVHGGTTPAGEVITVQVEDTGIGIPAEKQQRLFKRFSQVDGSIRREFGGTGLGLAISRQLVELMGGTIGVASTAGRGSVFMFTRDAAARRRMGAARQRRRRGGAGAAPGAHPPGGGSRHQPGARPVGPRGGRPPGRRRRRRHRGDRRRAGAALRRRAHGRADAQSRRAGGDAADPRPRPSGPGRADHRDDRERAAAAGLGVPAGRHDGPCRQALQARRALCGDRPGARRRAPGARRGRGRRIRRPRRRERARGPRGARRDRARGAPSRPVRGRPRPPLPAARPRADRPGRACARLVGRHARPDARSRRIARRSSGPASTAPIRCRCSRRCATSPPARSRPRGPGRTGGPSRRGRLGDVIQRTSAAGSRLLTSRPQWETER